MEMNAYERFQIVCTFGAVAGLIFWQIQRQVSNCMGPFERAAFAALGTFIAMLGLGLVAGVLSLVVYWVIYGSGA